MKKSGNLEDLTGMMEEMEEKVTGDKPMLPTFKMHSNNLKSLKELNISLKKNIKTLGELKRLRTITRAPQIYIPPIQSTEEGVEDEEEKNEMQYILFCRCGNICEKNTSLCKKCLDFRKGLEYSGYLYINNQETLKLCWVVLLDKEIYCTCLCI
jgi:hypothetical protein